MKIKNFGFQKVSARIEMRTVEHGRYDARKGELLTSEYKDIVLGEEAVYSLTFPTWSQSNYQLTWVRVGNNREEL